MEHGLEGRPLGADVPEGALPARAHRVRALAQEPGSQPDPPRRLPGQRTSGRRGGAGRHDRKRPPGERRAHRRADTRPHARKRVHPAQVEGPGGHLRRRHRAPPDAGVRGGLEHRRLHRSSRGGRLPPKAPRGVRRARLVAPARALPRTARRVRARRRQGVRASMALMRVVVVGLAIASWAACARTSVDNVSVRAVRLPRPQIIVVHDFGVSPGDVSLDSVGGKVGPDLSAPQSVASYRTRAWIKEYVRQPSKYRYTAMPDHTDLKDSDLDHVYEYLQLKSTQPEKKPQ